MLDTKIRGIESQIEDKHNKEKTVREEIDRDNRETRDEIERIDKEIAEINREKEAFRELEEGKIDGVEVKEDKIRDEYHCLKY